MRGKGNFLIYRWFSHSNHHSQGIFPGFSHAFTVRTSTFRSHRSRFRAMPGRGRWGNRARWINCWPRGRLWCGTCHRNAWPQRPGPKLLILDLLKPAMLWWLESHRNDDLVMLDPFFRRFGKLFAKLLMGGIQWSGRSGAMGIPIPYIFPIKCGADTSLIFGKWFGKWLGSQPSLFGKLFAMLWWLESHKNGDFLMDPIQLAGDHGYHIYLKWARIRLNSFSNSGEHVLREDAGIVWYNSNPQRDAKKLKKLEITRENIIVLPSWISWKHVFGNLLRPRAKRKP